MNLAQSDHKPAYSIVKVQLNDIYMLRLLVLRPGGSIADCEFDGDTLPGTAHYAVKTEEGEVLAIASFFERACPGIFAHRSIQLRGMATHPKVRGSGYGKFLLKAVLEGYRTSGVDLVWCNAREVAVPFYEKLGFQINSDVFLISGIGPHYRMHLVL